MNDVRAKSSRVLLDSTPRTFRSIKTTSTNENKYDYGQLPLKQADTNNKMEKHDQVNHSGLGISAWTKRLKSHELYRLVQ